MWGPTVCMYLILLRMTWQVTPLKATDTELDGGELRGTYTQALNE